MGDDRTPPSSLRWRSIGPYRGGRSVAVTGHPTEPLVYYMGTTGGGVWRTDNGGVTWRNLTDGYVKSSSVGAIALAASDPNVIYAGMGEACIRGNVSPGDGVYRSTDAGTTWQHLGLGDTRHIARVRVHPNDPDLVYVAALGHAFGPSRERGVFRSRDGGATWEHILFVSENTGAVDLSMDPTNPRILFASMYQVRRSAYNLVSGGPESALYRSTDGGDTWQRLGAAEGLPEGVTGRIGVSASGARSGRVWALYEHEKGGMFRSDDGGRHFTLTTEHRGPRSRPYYYTHVFADPQEADTVYILSAAYYRSTDGGKTFGRVATPHGDHHDLWIDPTNNRRQIHGADGGGAITLDGGRFWSSIHNQPTSEFYHVTTDNRFFYRVYGAQQDNTTLCVPSQSHYPALTKREWYEVGGAESGYIVVRSDNPDIVYAGSSGGGEGGRLTRYDHATKQFRDISPYPEKTVGTAAQDYTYRFQWTSPIFLSAHDGALYFCGNRIFRTYDDGHSWEIVSPDLTRNDPERMQASGGPITLDQSGVEIYCTVFAFAESPVQAGLLWAGTDDGRVHLSRDNAATWTEVTPKELPEWSLVSILEPSHHDAQTAYMATTRYKQDDTRPYLWKTGDAGKSWRRIDAGLPEGEYTRVIREDPEVAGLLYCGTERGAYVSFDDGATWRPLQLNLPVVPIHDLEVHGTDLVAATHGRAFWILDDVTPLRQLARGEDPGPTGLFAPRATFRSAAQSGFDRVPGEVAQPMIVADVYVVEQPATGDAPVFADAGQNTPPGVIFQYRLDKEPEGPVTIVVRDGQGREAVRLTSDKGAKGSPAPLPKTAGEHRRVWDMRYPAATTWEGTPSEWPTCAPLAAPGDYVVEFSAGDVRQTRALRLLPPTNVDLDQAAYDEQFALLCRIRDQVSAIRAGANTIQRVVKQLEDWEARTAGTDDADAVKAQAEALRDSLQAVRDTLVEWQVDNFQDTLNYKPRLNSRVAHLFGVVESADARPNTQSYQALETLEAKAAEALGGLQGILENDLPRFNALLAERRLAAVGA